MKLKIIVILLMFFITGCSKESNEDYVERMTGLDLSYCKIENVKDTHGGFLGDGEMITIFDCSNDNDKVLNQINDWTPLPLTTNLKLIMYGGMSDGVSYEFELASKNGIPYIINGYYYFINRHSKASSQTDDDIFGKYSFNFTLVMYDSDYKKLYYFEFDT